MLGYYALLGLDAGRGADVTETTIKRAFREAALQWHPDQQQVRCSPLCMPVCTS